MMAPHRHFIRGQIKWKTTTFRIQWNVKSIFTLTKNMPFSRPIIHLKSVFSSFFLSRSVSFALSYNPITCIYLRVSVLFLVVNFISLAIDQISIIECLFWKLIAFRAKRTNNVHVCVCVCVACFWFHPRLRHIRASPQITQMTMKSILFFELSRILKIDTM